ncbi:SWI/SNF and RSC complexes subunit arp9 [Lachnellula cervina]|uniref:SWI/SNF and RSC complexes subunit arp9 n=1 Tax=Lachnellula cervina TaxID=1316786 RepID=A0A7D8URX3_9HELO|nr:SWI/SNF and RSC complexes subunit arp9 [Lachnellula cervina]
MPPFRDEHILIIAPGSQTTLAQLGLPESFTPAAHRFPTRMFPAPDGKTYEPYKVKVQTRKKEDVEMKEGDGEREEGDEEEEIVELPEDEEGAVFPLKEGRIADMPAFFAFLQHIHTTLQPTLHTPIMLIAQPSWTAKNHEDLTAFIFEKFKTPALCIMDSALATSYAFGIANAAIVDVGYEKVDVTAITDYQIGGRGTVPSSGGNGMTKRLVELLKSKDFTHDMAEQLKKSPICEVLAPGVPMPGTEVAEEEISNPAAAASTGATASGPTVKITEAPRGPGPDTEVGEEGGDADDVDVEKAMEDDGVLDIATIVTSGKTQDFLAKKEKEKAERAAIRKATKEREAAEAAAARPLRLPNSKRPRAMFHYEELIKEPAAKRQKTPEPVSAIPAEEPAPAESKPDEEPTSAIEPPTAGEGQKKSNRRKLWEEENPDRSRRDIEIGLERFLAADPAYLDRIADTIYRTILSVDDISKRQDAWDALVICGCGSKVRGFKDALLQTLNHRYLVSPSSATMFMSELPSNLATPSGTGSMTPTASFSSTPHPPPTANAVNPLLLAATTASNPALNPGLQASASYAGSVHQHSSHSQSPTSIKIASPPTYFSEWKQYEEAVFLGSQVAAKVIFVVDQGLSKGFLSRTEFNEDGPGGIHQV